MPDEYDYFGQMNDAIKAANIFHSPRDINEDCPPPYYPIDMGKLYGLVKEVARLREIEAEKERMLDLLQWIYDDGHGGTYRADIQKILVPTLLDKGDQ
jgi:hypothetical protein